MLTTTIHQEANQPRDRKLTIKRARRLKLGDLIWVNDKPQLSKNFPLQFEKIHGKGVTALLYYAYLSNGRRTRGSCYAWEFIRKVNRQEFTAVQLLTEQLIEFTAAHMVKSID